MKVGYFQFDPRFGEVKRNLDYVSERLAAVECAQVFVPGDADPAFRIFS